MKLAGVKTRMMFYKKMFHVKHKGRFPVDN